MLSRVVARRVPPPPQPSVVGLFVAGQALCFGVGGCLREVVARRPWMADGMGMDGTAFDSQPAVPPYGLTDRRFPLTLIAILALALALAVMWRLTRFIVRLVLVGALIVVIASHLSGDTPHHAIAAPPRSIGQRHRPPIPRDRNGRMAAGKPATGTRK